jgi:anti-sigma28 factor (negative regulator of flagellin synthesis)
MPAEKKLIFWMIVPISQEAGLINRDFFLYGEYGELPMKNNNVTPRAPSFERRRFGRIHIFEPRICHIHLPQSQELWTDQGILVNISLGGIYFACDRQPPLEKDDICYLTFDTPYADPKKHHLGLHVSVVRTEQAQLDVSQFAVALRILSAPIYYSPHKTDKRESTSLDKPRIMYQYYDLNKKAYEIVTNTSEIRTEKINSIKEFIETGSYKVKSDKVTQRLINDLFLENILRLKS